MDQVPLNNPTPRNFIPGPQYNAGLFPTVEYLGSLTMTEDNSEPIFEEFAAANYMAEETVTSAYVMAVDKLSDNTTIILGARLEATDINYVGASFDVETGESYDDIELREGSNDYVNILPNLTIQTKLSDNFILNGAYTKSLARPGYYALTPYEEINSDDMEISVGNPDLEATVSNNVDIMAEYYFGPLGLFSAGFFYKNIDNWLYEFTDNNYTYNGETGYDYSQVRNGSNAEVTGFEFGLQTSLTDNDVQAFCARLFALRTLKMRDCENVTNQSCMRISQTVHGCLTQLDVSGCTQLNSDACGWLGGAV